MALPPGDTRASSGDICSCHTGVFLALSGWGCSTPHCAQVSSPTTDRAEMSVVPRGDLVSWDG